jgi:hypothetical protein
MKKPAKVIPLGKPLDTPDADLDMLALVTSKTSRRPKPTPAPGWARQGRGAAGDGQDAAARGR